MFLNKYHGNLDSRITSMSKEREEDLFRKYKSINKEIKKKQRNINCKTMILKMNIIKFLIYSGLYKGMRRKLRKCKNSNESEGVMYRTISIINEQYNKLLDETLLSTNNNDKKISSFNCKTNDSYSDINKSFNNINKEKNKLINLDKKISYNKINCEIDKNHIMNNKERKYDENQKKMKEMKRSHNELLIDWFNKTLKLNHDEFMIIEESQEFIDYYHDLDDNEIIEKINNKSIEACIQKQEKKEEKKRLRNEFLIDWFNKALKLDHDEFMIVEENEEFWDYYHELDDDDIIKKIGDKSREVCYNIMYKEMCDTNSNTIVEEISNNNHDSEISNHVEVKSEEKLLITSERKIEVNIITSLDNIHYTRNTNNLKNHIHIIFLIIIIITLILMIILRITFNIKKHYNNMNNIIKYNHNKLNYAKAYINDNLNKYLLYNPTTSSEEDILNELNRKLFKKPVRKIFDPGGLIKLIVLYCC